MRKPRLFLFVIYLVFAGFESLYSQGKNLDSLQAAVKSLKEDTNKVIELNELARDYGDAGEPEKGFRCLKESMELSQRLGDKKGIVNTYNDIGVLQWGQGNFLQALKNHYDALKLAEQIGYKKGMASAYNNLGVVNSLLKKPGEALKNYELALKLYKELNAKRAVAMAYSNIGIVCEDRRDLAGALKNYMLALKMFEELGDKYSIAATYGNIALEHDLMGNYDEAIKSYEASIRMNTELGNKGNLIHPLLNLGELYVDLKKPRKAEPYLNRGLKLSGEIGDRKAIHTSYFCLALMDSALGNYKLAYTYMKLAGMYNDSIYNEENATQANELSALYESEKKQKEIVQLNLDLLTKQKTARELNIKVQQKNGIIYGIILTAILLLVSIFLFFSRRQLKQKNSYQMELSRQNEINATAIIQAQENERNSIAKDLHDGVGTSLSTLKLNMQIPNDHSAAGNTLQLIDAIALELRNVMINLSSETLLENGLVAGIEELVERVNRLDNVRIDFKYHGFPRQLEKIVEVNLYRVIQELINNCIKHAAATKATLQLIGDQDGITLMMEDNGKGFEPASGKQTVGMGLKNIGNRIAFIKGTFKMEAAKGRGATFIIELPTDVI